MGVAGVTGKVLEVSGKILQAEGVEDALKKQVEKLIEKFAVDKGIRFFRTRRGRSEILRKISSPLNLDDPLRRTIESTYDDFIRNIYNLFDAIQYLASVYPPSTILVPRNFIVELGFEPIGTNLHNYYNFQRFYPDKDIQEIFIEALRRSLIESIEVDQAPSSKTPLKFGNECYLVKIDLDGIWSSKYPTGSYYFYCTRNTDIASKDVRKNIEDQIDSLDNMRGRAEKDKVDTNTASYVQIAKNYRELKDWHRVKMNLLGKCPLDFVVKS